MRFLSRFATGVVIGYDSAADEMRPLGTCAAYEGRTTWITAAHCVPDDRPVVVLRYGLPKFPRAVAEVHRHPDVDLAVIRISTEDDGAPEGLEDSYFVRPQPALVEGGDFLGFGYPADDLMHRERLIKGYFQAYLVPYEPPSGGPYLAGEMSIPAPGGLSGTVLSYTHLPSEASAMVTSNVESTVVVDSYEEVEKEGIVSRGEIRRVVSYGIAMMLNQQADWLGEVVAD